LGAFLGVLGDQGHPLGQLVALLLHAFALLPVLDGVVGDELIYLL
jgi:hypothetical protein